MTIKVTNDSITIPNKAMPSLFIYLILIEF